MPTNTILCICHGSTTLETSANIVFPELGLQWTATTQAPHGLRILRLLLARVCHLPS